MEYLPARPLVKKIPLWVQVLAAVVLGTIAGLVFGAGDVTAALGKLGLLVIRALKALAIPLVLFAIVDAIARTEVTLRAGGKLMLICLMNVSVAFAIGLTLMNGLRPGDRFRGQLETLVQSLGVEGPARAPQKITLSPIENLQGWIPESVAQPFVDNAVIGVVLLAVLAGAALRVTSAREEPGASEVVRFVRGAYGVLVQMLTWVVHAIPFAVFGVVAQVVGKAGLGPFAALAPFVAVILTGFTLHALVYYPAMAWLVGGKTPRVYLGKGADAVLTGLSTNSSLATVPVTLKCLERMGVREENARLSALVGTNLNNDGITLYEAMTALFLAQAAGYQLGLGAQATVVLASVLAGVGIAGIPEAGLIMLPLVLGAAGLPEGLVAGAIPLVFSVDWILARGRSAVNVLADMLVAILLDRR